MQRGWEEGAERVVAASAGWEAVGAVGPFRSGGGCWLSGRWHLSWPEGRPKGRLVVQGLAEDRDSQTSRKLLLKDILITPSDSGRPAGGPLTSRLAGGPRRPRPAWHG